MELKSALKRENDNDEIIPERERERERMTATRERQRQTETERDRDRQTDRERQRENDSDERERERERQRQRQTDRQTEITPFLNSLLGASDPSGVESDFRPTILSREQGVYQKSDPGADRYYVGCLGQTRASLPV